jgi:hypothetical protein
MSKEKAATDACTFFFFETSTIVLQKIFFVVFKRPCRGARRASPHLDRCLRLLMLPNPPPPCQCLFKDIRDTYSFKEAVGDLLSESLPIIESLPIEGHMRHLRLKRQ